MTTQAEFYGGSIRLTISSDQQLSRMRAWHWGITASVTSLAVRLPDATKLIKGYPVIQVMNEGANTFDIEDFDGTVLVTAAAQDEVYTFALFDNSTTAGDWESGEWGELGGSPPAVVVFPWTLGGNAGGMLSNAWRYDFVVDSWSEPGGTSTDFIIFSAGFEVAGVGFAAGASSLESFDPSAWAVETARATNSRDAAGAKHATDDKGYVFGDNAVTDGADADSYDVSDDSWTSLTDMSATRHKHSMQKGLDDTVMYHGGATSYLALHQGTTHQRSYDIAADSHSNKTSSALQRLYSGSTIDRDNDYWVYAGEEDSNGPDHDDVEQYDYSSDSWTTETLVPQGANSEGGATHVEINGMSYTIGGGGTTSNGDALYEHNPQSDSYVAGTDHAASSFSAIGIGQGTTLSLTD